MRAARCRGQAAVELLAALPIVLVAGLVAWQLVGVLAAGLRAQHDLREHALHAAGASGRTVVVGASAAVPAVLPGMEGLRVRARVGVRLP